ncbi:MAG: nucleotidyl transferase AbiEii/AbiGii toxin family protein [Actinomycetota bacterium]
MIDEHEITTRARRLGVDPSYIQKDYVLNCVLAAIAQVGDGLVFRGGTALARVFWPDFRLSEDLDFITTSRIAPKLAAILDQAVDAATLQSGLDLRLDFGPPKGHWSRSLVRSDRIEILIDINLGDRPYLPVEHLELDLPYSDSPNPSPRIGVVQLAEILGNKWFMLDDSDRNEPRDLFDVWAGLQRFDVAFEELARGHRAKYGFAPMIRQLRNARRLEPLWVTRLSHQLVNLPPFDDVYASVLRYYEAWHGSSGRGADD